jgi:GNAT superfamily N-acetyltransferase
MLKDIIIRQATALDVPTLVEYNQGLAKETENISLDEATLRQGVENALHRNDCQYFAAELNGRVIGQTMVTTEWSDWRNGEMWWMQSVYVHPDYRKRGVFPTIFWHIEKLAESNPDVKALRLYVMHDNQAGRNSYQNLGMDDSGYLVYELST